MTRAALLPLCLAGLIGCSPYSPNPETKSGLSVEVVQNAAVNGAAKAASSGGAMIISETVSSEEKFFDNFEDFSDIGGMVLKVDISGVNEAGLMSAPSGGDVIIFEDPTCEGCSDAGPLLSSQGVSFVKAPVAFYSENGLDKVGKEICAAKNLEDPGEACAALVVGMMSNTKFAMLQGIVDLPAVLLPSGWLIESIDDETDVKSLIRERGDE